MFADPGDGALVVPALIAAYSLVLGLSEARLNRARKELEAQLRPREPQPTTTA